MNRLLSSVAVLTLAAGISLGQAQVTVTLEPEVQTQVREYVVTRAEPVTAPVDFDFVVGATVPDAVELRAIEGIPAVVDYQYVLVDDRIVLVDPSTRAIVSLLDTEENGEGEGQETESQAAPDGQQTDGAATEGGGTDGEAGTGTGGDSDSGTDAGTGGGTDGTEGDGGSAQ